MTNPLLKAPSEENNSPSSRSPWRLRFQNQQTLIWADAWWRSTVLFRRSPVHIREVVLNPTWGVVLSKITLTHKVANVKENTQLSVFSSMWDFIVSSVRFHYFLCKFDFNVSFAPLILIKCHISIQLLFVCCQYTTEVVSSHQVFTSCSIKEKTMEQDYSRLWRNVRDKVTCEAIIWVLTVSSEFWFLFPQNLYLFYSF